MDRFHTCKSRDRRYDISSSSGFCGMKVGVLSTVDDWGLREHRGLVSEDLRKCSLEEGQGPGTPWGDKGGAAKGVFARSGRNTRQR